MDNSAWHPEDKEWLEKRKPEWRQIQRHLKLFKGQFRGEYLKYHKDLYFYGRVDPEIEKEGGGGYFGWALPFFICWYHPEPSLENFQAVFNAQIRGVNLEKTREYLFEVFPSASKFDSQYGMLGGREELMVKMLVPSLDPSKEKDFSHKHLNYLTGEETIKITKYSLCLVPDLIARYCLNGILPPLLGFSSNPYAPGQYLWDHLCALVDSVNDESSLKRLRELARIVLTIHEDKNFPNDDPTAVALAKRLISGYNKREFSEAMLTIWDEEKLKIEGR